MILYLLIFGGVFAWYYTTPQRKANNAKVLFAVLLFLALFVGLGDMLGGFDRYVYGAHFDYIADFVYYGDYRSAFTQFWTEGKPTEWVFSFIYVIISFITRNRYIYILIMTLVIYSLLFVSFKRYFKSYPLGIILFLGLWFFFTFTYLRQVLACTIAWFSIRYVVKRDLVRYVICIIVAYMMHNSAIVFFPLYFVPIRKFEKDKVINIMLLLGIIGITNIAGMLFNSFGGIIGAEERTEEYAKSSAFRYEYIIEAVLFLTVILNHYRHFKNRDKEDILLLNMSLIFCGILLLFSMNTQGGRLSWFYMIGLIATLTKIGKSVERLSQNNMMLILLAFALFSRIVWEWDILLSPYKTFLTDGVREEDFIWAGHEYDHQYDKDKMYRDPWTLW